VTEGVSLSLNQEDTMNDPEQETLSPEWEQRVRDELEPGEDLVWASQPLPVSTGRAALDAWPWMLFGVIWLGFTAFGYFMWQSSHADRKRFDDDFEKNFQDDFFREARERRRKDAEGVSMFDVVPLAIAGIAGLVGVALLLSPLWMTLSRKRRQSRSCYALTTRRALVWEPASGGQCLHSYDPARLGALKRVERDDGSGDLVFEEYTYTYQVNVAPAGSPPSYQSRQGIGQRGFMNISRVREVERLLRQTLLS
jgi:hypothetical protein